jgi:hypothetical protein
LSKGKEEEKLFKATPFRLACIGAGFYRLIARPDLRRRTGCPNGLGFQDLGFAGTHENDW